MRMNVFLKGMGLGLLAGATVTAIMMPIDKRKLSKSGAGKTIRAIGHVVENITDAIG